MSDYEMGRYVAVRPALVEALAGDLVAAVVWSLVRYRQGMEEHYDGWAASYRELSTWTGVDQRRIKRATKMLAEHGWLTWGRASWADSTNVYRALVGVVIHRRQGGDETSLRTVTKRHSGEGRNVTPDSDKTSLPESDETSLPTTYLEQQQKKKKRPHSAECRQAAELLADLIHNNGSKRPAVTDRWLTDMDRLHRIDGRTWEQITAAIHWCQQDDFWRANILSPAALRKQYERLRLQAQRDTKTSKARSGLALLNKLKENADEPRRITGTADAGQLLRPDTAAGA